MVDLGSPHDHDGRGSYPPCASTMVRGNEISSTFLSILVPGLVSELELCDCKKANVLLSEFVGELCDCHETDHGVLKPG